MAESTVINRNTWKVWMSSTPTNPQASLHSLYDLLTNGEMLYCSQNANTTEFVGADLGHDIIIYRNDLYFTSGRLNTTKSFSTWELYGIDLNCPNYDKRNKPLKFKLDNTKLTELQNSEFYIYDKSAALIPPTIEAFHNDSDVTSLSPWDTGSNQDWSQYNRLFTVGSQDRSGSLPNADIILVNKDTVFQASMIFESGKDAFTGMYLNGTEQIVEFISRCLKKHFIGDSTLIDSLKGHYSSNTELLSALCGDEQFSYLLKHIYIWVKAPYAADYIRPEDFDQDLNKDANVIHKNIYARASTGDYNRYAETAGKDEEASSKMYIPKNAPLKDYVSSKYIHKKDSTEATMEALIADADSPESEIGSVFTEPIKDTQSLILDGATTTDLTPPQFFDPESRRTADTYNRVPTVIPKTGNSVSDSRVISPTIDELWYIIKKIISGRPADTNTIIGEDFAKSYASAEKGQEGSDRKGNKSRATAVNDKDTTLTEVENSFIFEYNDGLRMGDPVDFEIIPSYTLDEKGNPIENSNAGLSITEFFSQPNETVYVDFAEVIKDTETLEKWVEENKNYVSISEVSIPGIDTESKIGQDTDWLPRSAPLSMRELESRILGNKYEIIKNYRYITTNFGVVGPLGMIRKDESGEFLNAGSLYQFHKDYNFNHSNPNSHFNTNGKGEEAFTADGEWNPKSGYDAEFSDITNEEDGILLYNSDIAKKSKRPLLVENYGKSRYLDENNEEYYGSDIYLSAIGDWRYKSEHLRAPILRSRY